MSGGPTRGHERQVQGIGASLQKVRGCWRVHQIANGAGVPRSRDVPRDLDLFCA